MEKVTLSNICYYIQGNLREYLYFSKFRWMLRTHIREQIYYRINVMNRECYAEGFCIKCGCDTPALQMADKACKGLCYPEMMTKEEWRLFKLKKKKDGIASWILEEPLD